MDRLGHNAFCQSVQAPNPSLAEFHQPQPDIRTASDQLHSNSRQQAEPSDSIATRKVQKADREKLRRDRLNEHFTALGNTLDPDRPKNDKASIITDTIQVLKDLTGQVNRLKAEYATLTEESRELTEEKNDLKEEKTSLKSDIENLNIQYQQRLRAMYPWTGVDHSVVMHPPSYPFPLQMPIAPGPMPLHPSLQPYPFFGNQNPALVPYLTHNTLVEPQSTQYVSSVVQPVTRSCKKVSPNKSSDLGESRIENSEEPNDVATELELKTPGSTADQVSSLGHRKSKKVPRKESSDRSSSNKCSSSHSVQGSSSNSVVGSKKADE